MVSVFQCRVGWEELDVRQSERMDETVCNEELRDIIKVDMGEVGQGRAVFVG